MSLTQFYTLADITRWYPNNEIHKAKAYLNSISELEVNDASIIAQVQGRTGVPYRVEIVLSQGQDGKLAVRPSCSCPVGYLCKHTAAVLLSVLSLPRPPSVKHAVTEWIESMRGTLSTPLKKKPSVTQRGTALCYALVKSSQQKHYVVQIYKAKLDGEGQVSGDLEPWDTVERALLNPPQYVREEDMPILRLLLRQHDRYDGYQVLGKHGNELLTRLLSSGRLFFRERVVGSRDRLSHPLPLKAGESRPAHIAWGADDQGCMQPTVIRSGNAVHVLALPEDTWYIDATTGEMGQLQLAQAPAQVAKLLSMPPLNDMEMLVVAAALRDLLPELPAPSKAALRSLKAKMLPVMSLDTSDAAYRNAYRGYAAGSQIRDFARVQWRYGDAMLSPDHPSEFVTLASGETVRVVRDTRAETQALKVLHGHGLKEMPNVSLTGSYADYSLFGLDNAAAWPEFMQQAVPELRAVGWQIDMLTGFRHHVLEVQAWLGDFDEQADGWFSLNMGIVVNGERVPLAPLLHELFKVDSRWLDALHLEMLPDQEPITLQLPDGGQVKVPAARIKPLARTLLELFDGGGMRGDGIRLSRYDVARIQQLADMERWQFKGADALIALANQLKNTNGIQEVQPPKNFPLELRPYQLEGLAWLQFLRENRLAGILADDMGLGKTAQALAHLLLEKQSGRMDRPTLVVLPTSLIFNWKREAERFAPDLKLLSLHGKQRAGHFAAIPHYDVILTTYPLLWRDEEMLSQYEYHLLILDEAQTVKNAASQAAQVVRKLKARHRLCLTGTPLENHLGDLWSQFDFLLPGLLGDARSFTRTWRTPIEKQGNTLRRNLLAQRVRPFILRRRKQDVASELPPKTLIVRSVELSGAQRDLYETVRIAMDQRVREEIADKGFARSHIIILDALLKLRQVCCDPRLLKLTAAKNVQEHAKLDMLMEMLPELVSEGRRILVFSQFTSMLELIEAELHKEKLGYVKLTGDTQNREEVVRRFQDGEVPIFLISLKAGGVGLNLTTADTVIHYDPWWNPAVENQATDRAHRLGQLNNVFVYKLVVAGSIEEKILALQEKKAELAAGILSEDSSGLVKFGEADIAALLAPLPVDEVAA